MTKLLALNFLLLLSLLILHNHQNAEARAAKASGSDNFISTSCRRTRYPPLCVQCLSSYANTIQQNEETLVQTALSVGVSRAQAATLFVAKLSQVQGIKPREYQAVKDCVNNLKSSVNQLSQSITELGQMNKSTNGDDYEWHASNLQTWISGALTSENICLDGFARKDMDGNIKVQVRSKVVELAQITSNALALTEQFASRHRPVRKP